LGAAAATKRPTSVVLILKPGKDDKYSKKYNKIEKKVRKLNKYV